MKPSDLYARKAINISRDINYLIGCYYNHIPEIQNNSSYRLEGVNRRIFIHYYKEHCFDDRRTWTLAAVEFDNEFVMVIQNAGREGDDHSKRFITNKSQYDEMVKYIRALLPAVDDDVSSNDVVGLEDDIEGLADFYGHRIDGYFETC